MKPPKKLSRRETGLELRRTHYTLGNDQWNYLSQYRHDYPPWPFEGGYDPNMDSVLLRRTHFKLGDYQNPYCTTNMDQSKNVLCAGSPACLDEAVKNDLRRSHFSLGTFEPNYNTSHQQEYYDKSKLNDLANVNFKNVERGLRSHNYVLGNDRPDYISETQAKYVRPLINPADVKDLGKISTAQLQQSHYVFGTNNDPWVTTQQASFVPKEIDQKLFTKNLTKTNFILGDYEPTLKSVNQETFIKHPMVYNPINKDLANDLRKHHFSFGNENYPDHLKTVHNQDYQDPMLHNDGNTVPRIDPTFLRASHWSLGDKTQEPATDHYATTYGLAMQPKTRIDNQPVPNSTFKSGFSLVGNDPNTYATESRSNFIPMLKAIDPLQRKLQNDVVKDIKSSHFDLGDTKNDYGTTTGAAYKFDPLTAGAAKQTLDRALLNDLRSTHYKLGYLPENNQTTYQSNYIPMNIDYHNAKDPLLRASHFSLNCTNNAIQDGKTIYMTDYVPKELPEDNY